MKGALSSNPGSRSMMACRAATLASGLLNQRVDRRTFQWSGGDSYHSRLSCKVIEFIIDEIVKRLVAVTAAGDLRQPAQRNQS